MGSLSGDATGQLRRPLLDCRSTTAHESWAQCPWLMTMLSDHVASRDESRRGSKPEGPRPLGLGSREPCHRNAMVSQKNERSKP